MRKNKLPPIVTILVLTLIVVVFWIFFSVYRVFSNKPSPTVPEAVLAPIEGRLDTQTIEEIKTRIYQEGSTITIVTTPEPVSEETSEGELGGQETPAPTQEPVVDQGNSGETGDQSQDNINNNQ